METKLLVLSDYKETGLISAQDEALIEEAAVILRNGGLCAFPTETVYGLGGDAFDKTAAKRIYAAKGRPSDNPLIVHIADAAMLKDLVCSVPEEAAGLIDAFWPGPMTLIFKKKPALPDETTGGLHTVAVRFPSHPAAAMLIKKAGVPVAAPSANRSGRPSTTCAAHCMEDLNGLIEAVLDGGSCEIGLESTIIDFSQGEPVLLRPGAVTMEMISSCLGKEIAEDAALKGPLPENIRPKAPGMKYRHYAPAAPMVLVCRGEESPAYAAAEKMAGIINEKLEAPGLVAVLCSEECKACLKKLLADSAAPHAGSLIFKSTGSRADLKNAARKLFSLLRECDSEGVSFIVAEGFSEKELGLAVMNRLKKASGWQVIYA